MNTPESGKTQKNTPVDPVKDKTVQPSIDPNKEESSDPVIPDSNAVTPNVSNPDTDESIGPSDTQDTTSDEKNTSETNGDDQEDSSIDETKSQETDNTPPVIPDAVDDADVSGEEGTSIYTTMLLDYVEAMGDPTLSSQEGIKHQYRLLNIYKQVLSSKNIESFQKHWNELLDVFKDNIEGVLSPASINRFVRSHWTKSPADLQLMLGINNLLVVSIRHPKNKVATKIDMGKLPKTIPTDVQQEIIKYYT